MSHDKRLENENVIILLQAQKQFLSSAERKLSDYILENTKKVLQMTTKQLAANSGISEATVVRLCKRLGLSGYSEFKLKLSADLATPEFINPMTEIDPNDTPKAIFDKLTSTTVKSLDYTKMLLNDNELERAVNLIEKTIQNKNRIFISAVGASSIPAESLQIKFMRLGVQTIYYNDEHLSFESIQSIDKNDILIVFSSLGKSAHTNNCIDIAKIKNATVILCTQYGNEEFSAKGDIKLLSAIVENNLRLVSLTSIIVQLMIVDSIFTSLAVRQLDAIKKDVMHTKEKFKEYHYYDN